MTTTAETASSPRAYRHVEVVFAPGDHEFWPRWEVIAWDQTFNNHRSNPRYWSFRTKAEAEGFAATVPRR